MEQAISAVKAATKADVSRPEQQEQMNYRVEVRRQGIALSNFRTQLLLQALHGNSGTVTAAKCGQWYLCKRYAYFVITHSSGDFI